MAFAPIWACRRGRGIDVLGRIARRAGLVVLCAGLLGQAARGDQNMTENDVILSMEWQLKEGHVIAAYKVENRSAHPVMLFDRLFVTRPDGGRIVDPDRAYITVMTDGMMLVDKLVPALPADSDVESPEVPYARLVPPGGELSGQALVGTPVLTNPPYGQPATGAMARRVKNAVFRIGYAYVTDTMIAVPARGSEDEIWSLRHNWASTNQRVLQGPILSMDMDIVQPLAP